EMRALREALRNANPGRWAGLLRGTAHPGHRRHRAEGGAEELAPAAVLDADRGGRQRYRGPDAILSALGYAAGPAGERRLLEGLSRLRLAFVAQQQRSLGRTVWRAQWMETPALW
ncbi:MAG TPA: hypothetical protein VKY89_13560, partial [Thermoanaerobaculia bacterium]|nr:hypothetical protein [Thermoanaerobaculia bacterium]